MLTVDLDELLRGLEAQEQDGLWTRAELQDAWGMGEKAVLRTLRRLNQAGRLVTGRKKNFETLAGHSVPVPAYGFVMGEEK